MCDAPAPCTGWGQGRRNRIQGDLLPPQPPAVLGSSGLRWDESFIKYQLYAGH